MEEARTTTRSSLERRHRLAAWVAREVLPHEAGVRAWLGRARIAPEDIDEVIQDAYCRLAQLDTIDHIDRPDAYFFSVARNLLVRRLKRARIVPIETIAEIEAFNDELRPSPERQVGDRIDYARMLAFMDALPRRCGTIVRLRKIEGWSQKEIAAHLGITEKAVEKQIWTGVKAIQQAWDEADSAARARLRAFENGTGRG